MRKHVVTLVPERFHFFEMAVTSEVFGLDRSSLTKDWYQFSMAGVSSTARATGGYELSGLKSLKVIEKADTVIVPGWYDLEANPAPVMKALQRAHSRGTRIVSICTGAFALAHAGLLDGRQVTTHWAYSADLARMFPKVKVDPKPLYIQSGNIWTSAGTMAGVDLCLELVRIDHGVAIANEIARRMVAPAHRDGGQAQFIDRPLPKCNELQPILDWAMTKLHEPLTVPVLAKKAAMSDRTFARKFLQNTGTTPHDWIVQARIGESRRLLEKTTLSIDEIAERVGMESSNFRLQFKERLHTSPLKYRSIFKTKR